MVRCSATLCSAGEQPRSLWCEHKCEPLAASEVASVADASTFRNGRERAEWVGVLPRQCSTGRRTVLLGTSKRGNKYSRSQLILGARAALRTTPRGAMIAEADGHWRSSMVRIRVSLCVLAAVPVGGAPPCCMNSGSIVNDSSPQVV